MNKITYQQGKHTHTVYCGDKVLQDTIKLLEVLGNKIIDIK